VFVDAPLILKSGYGLPRQFEEQATGSGTLHQEVLRGWWIGHVDTKTFAGMEGSIEFLRDLLSKERFHVRQLTPGANHEITEIPHDVGCFWLFAGRWHSEYSNSNSEPIF
jgi:hypothetical protein